MAYRNGATITVVQLEPRVSGNEHRYVVLSATNTTYPILAMVLQKSEVDRLITEKMKVNIVLPDKDTKRLKSGAA